MGKVQARMVCHTHWDREWYLTREQFKTKMVRLIDNILNCVEQDPESVLFMLDGQTIILEDYLAVRPEREPLLQYAVRQGIISIGPWYILPDEMLISGESHIRNYLTGLEVGKRFGRTMNIGYLPDSFGHPEQMPQILSGLSMDAIVFWRGMGRHMTHTEFYWRAKGGNGQVLGVNMPNGYGNSARLSADIDETAPRLDAMIEDLRAQGTTEHVLLMNGSDHILNQKNISAILAEYNRRGGYQIALSTMQDFLDALKGSLKELEVFEGELRYGDRTILLGGTMSARVYLKQRNNCVQRLMERYLEPLSSAEALLGLKWGFLGYQKYLWKKILENQPHDSICGCSIDEVHREMMTRFDSVEQLERTLFADGVRRIAQNAKRAQDGEDAQVVYFEPTQDGLPSYAIVTVDLDPMLVKRVNFAKSSIDEYEDSISHPPMPQAVQVKDERGQILQAHLISGRKDYFMHLQDETLPEVYKVNRLTIGLVAPGDSYGLHTLYVSRIDNKPQSVHTDSEESIENEYYKISFEGTAFTVLDKKTGREHKGVARLVDKGDAGDEYTYSWPDCDAVFEIDPRRTSVRVNAVGGIYQELIVEGEMQLPQSLSPDRSRRDEQLVSNPVKLVAALSKATDRIDFTVEVENRSKDHVLSVELPAHTPARLSRATTAFALTEHDTKRRVVENWMEYPFPTHACHGFIDVGDEHYGACVSAEGLYEYEAGEDGCVHLTLLRCVGYLSRADLNTRVGNGGWELATPGAQCLGKHSFRFGLTYRDRPLERSGAFALSERMLNPPAFEQVFAQDAGANVRNPLGFISQLGEMVRLSALKITEDGQDVLMRVFSVGRETAHVSLRLPDCIGSVKACNLAEQPLEDAEFEFTGNALSFRVSPGQIRSFRLVNK